MEEKLELVDTADGSHTLYIPKLQEHYHSVNGAIQESNHVFIEAGLHEAIKTKKEIWVLEIGFGTGLNAYLTLLQANRLKIKIYYYCLELYPLGVEIIRKINYPVYQESSDKAEWFNKLHETEWNNTVEIIPCFYLNKINADFTVLEGLSIEKKFDLIYFDAFAPDKQPEMWTQEIFNYLYSYTREKGTLVTYCAKGKVRRMMQEAGYMVERLPGPKGKREMLRAKKT